MTEDIIEAWKAENKEKILELLRENGKFLRDLGEKSSIDIETKKLAILSKIADRYGGAGKVSGAGGGDCGIAVTFDQANSEKIVEEWKKEGIDSIDIGLSLEGVREEF